MAEILLFSYSEEMTLAVKICSLIGGEVVVGEAKIVCAEIVEGKSLMGIPIFYGGKRAGYAHLGFSKVSHLKWEAPAMQLVMMVHDQQQKRFARRVWIISSDIFNLTIIQ